MVDKPLNAGEMLEKVGYSKAISQTPNRVIESEGVMEALNDYGFNPETAKQVVGEILIGGENDNVKLKAAEMVFKVHGTFADGNQPISTTTNFTQIVIHPPNGAENT